MGYGLWEGMFSARSGSNGARGDLWGCRYEDNIYALDGKAKDALDVKAKMNGFAEDESPC